MLGEGERIKTRGEAGDVTLKSLVVSRIVPLGPWFEDVAEFNINTYERKMLEKYKVETIINQYRDYRDGEAIFDYSKTNRCKRNHGTLAYVRDYYALIEKICEEYNLTCDRW